MILISEALEIIKRETFVVTDEPVNIENSVGRVLAETIKADLDLPPFNRSQMDGFAIKSDDVTETATLQIIGESVAGKGFERELKSGEAVRIMTGAPVPKGADAVQKVELTREENGFINILKPTKIKQNVVERGEEIRKGAEVFQKGEMITENMIASLASFGYAALQVARKPRAAILGTGSEIVAISQRPDKDQIRNSNSMMLKVYAEKAGAETVILPSVKDDISHLKSQMMNALKNNDLLIITGGVSVGDYDFTKPALRALGAEIFFEKLSLKPGKPTVFAKLDGKLIFGLPGNPVSAAVTFFLFVRTALLLMQGAKNFELTKGFAVVADKIKGAKERDAVLPVSLTTNQSGYLTIQSLRFSGSSNFIAFSGADALAFIPQGKIFEKGDVAEVYFL